MGTALIYLLVVAAVAAAVFGLAAAVFGRGEELAPLPPGPTPAWLPVGEIGGDDLRELRLPQAVRGYRMAEVDWVLDRLADQLDRALAERDHLEARVAELDRSDRSGPDASPPRSARGGRPAPDQVADDDGRLVSPQRLGEAPVGHEGEQ